MRSVEKLDLLCNRQMFKHVVLKDNFKDQTENRDLKHKSFKRFNY